MRRHKVWLDGIDVEARGVSINPSTYNVKGICDESNRTRSCVSLVSLSPTSTKSDGTAVVVCVASEESGFLQQLN